MKIAARIFVGFALLVIAGAFIGFNLPVQVLVDFESYGLEVENTQDARVHAGVLRMRAEDYAEFGIINLSWSWCPGLKILNWCTEVDTDSLQSEGEVAYQISGGVKLTDLKVELDSLEFLGLVPGLVNAKIRGQIHSMHIQDFDCPLRNSQNLSAEFELIETSILGGQLEDIQVRLEQQGDQYLITATGSQLEGEFIVERDLTYLGSGEITPPANLVGMMGSLARPLGGGRFGWELEGQIPC